MEPFRNDPLAYKSTAEQLSPTFNDLSQAVANNRKRPETLVIGDKRDEIISYYVGQCRAFNYAPFMKRYRPYNIDKDAYDLNFYNYGFNK
jgi:hypothetical protein